MVLVYTAPSAAPPSSGNGSASLRLTDDLAELATLKAHLANVQRASRDLGEDGKGWYGCVVVGFGVPEATVVASRYSHVGAFCCGTTALVELFLLCVCTG